MNTHKTAWIFDVDGVLTNLGAREITQPILFPSLAQIIDNHNLLAFNTGRDARFVKSRIINHLALHTKSPLKDIFIASEKGGVWQEADKAPQINETFALPPAFVEKVKLLITQEFADCVFFDETKRTMISIEMIVNTPLHYFTPRQKRLNEILTMYLQMAGLSSSYILQEDLIATDIIHKDAGKDVGMQHILTWIETHGHSIDHYYCFGDNPSDTHMGELLAQKKLPFTFVYVGTKPLPPLSFTPLITENKFDAGTAEAVVKLL